MDGVQGATQRQPRVVTLWWWFLTLLVLVILDDLTFGPFFWFMARMWGAIWAVAAIYAIYVPVQILLVDRGTREEPGRIAHWFLSRLDLERRYSHVQHNEHRLRSRVVGWVSAVSACLLIGGVLPPLLLWRQGFERNYVMRVAVVTSVVYATEFAILHGLVPAAI